MPRFAANLTMLFTEVPFMERFSLASAAGFEAVEFLFPYAYDASEIRQQLDMHGLTLVLHNLPPGNWDAGERGLACIPQRTAEFRASVVEGVHFAKQLGVQQLHCMAGIVPKGVEASIVRNTLIENLRYASQVMRAANMRLLIEPINAFDMPGYYLSRVDLALTVLDELNVDNAFLQFDIYHAQRTQGELIGTIAGCLDRIGHIQIADNPGRHEPGTGEINFDFLFAYLDQCGYAGWVGCEYVPATNTLAGLGWLNGYTCRASRLAQ